MKQRNPIAVALLPFVTFGIYAIYWQVKTKGELNAKGATIPTAWLIIVPFVNIWWMWKYSEGVEQITSEKMSAVLAFILLWLLGPIGAAIIQNSFNQLGESPVTAAAPVASTVATPAAPSDVTTPPTTPVAS